MTKPASYRFGPRQFSDPDLSDEHMRQLREEELSMRAPHEGLKRIRKKHGKSQAEMAEIMEVSRRTYQDFEAGKRAIPSDAFLHLHAAFDCDLHQLITGRPIPIPREAKSAFVQVALDAAFALLDRYGVGDDGISTTDLRHYASLAAELTEPGEKLKTLWLLEMVGRERSKLQALAHDEYDTDSPPGDESCVSKYIHDGLAQPT